MLNDVLPHCILPLGNAYSRHRQAPLREKLALTYHAFFTETDVQAALEEFPSSKEGLIDPAAAKILNNFYSDLHALDKGFAPAAVVFEYISNFRLKIVPDFIDSIDKEEISTRKRKAEEPAEGYDADDEEEEEDDDEDENESFITSASGSEAAELDEDEEEEEGSWDSDEETEVTDESNFADDEEDDEGYNSEESEQEEIYL